LSFKNANFSELNSQITPLNFGFPLFLKHKLSSLAHQGSITSLDSWS
jgi:hypothetical protein